MSSAASVLSLKWLFSFLFLLFRVISWIGFLVREDDPRNHTKNDETKIPCLDSWDGTTTFAKLSLIPIKTEPPTNPSGTNFTDQR
jgi:hypothetical protein